MSSEPLVNTYRRYKAGTQKLMTWLSEAAERCETSAASREGRQGKRTAKVSTRDLITFAQDIVQSKQPIIEIRLDILDIAKEVLVARTQFVEFYAELERLAKDESSTGHYASLVACNSGHRHFVEVLQHVHDLLREEHKARRLRSQASSLQQTEDVDGLVNRYQHLELQEPMHQELSSDHQAHTIPVRLDSELTRRTVIETEESDDVAFHVYCLLKDLQNMIIYIRSIWQQVAAGELDILTAAKLTESASGLAVFLCDELEEQHPQLMPFEAILDLFDPLSLLRKDNLDSRQGTEKTRPAETRVGPISSGLLLIQPYKALQAFTTAAEIMAAGDGFAPITTTKDFAKTANFADYIRTLPRLFKSCFSFVKGYKDVRFNEAFKSAVRVLDTYTGHLLAILGGDTINLATVVCTQFSMDIYEALNCKIDQGFLAASNAIARCDDSIKALQLFTLDLTEYEKKWVTQHTVDWIPNKSKVVKVQRRKEQVTGWNVWECYGSAQSVFVARAVLTAMPLLAALKGHRMLSGHSAAAVKVCGGLAITQCAAHLHKAGLVAGHIKEPWKDLEMFVNRQNELGTFVRNGNDSIRSIADQFGLALGMDLKQLRQLEPQMAPNLDVVRRQGLRTSIACRHMLAELDVDEVQDHLTDASVKTRTLYEIVKKVAATPIGFRDRDIAKQWAKNKKLEPVQLLSVSLDVLVEDEPYLVFDYVAFFQRCVKWLGFQGDFWISIAPEQAGQWGMYDGTLMTLRNAAMAESNGYALKRDPLRHACAFIEPISQRSGNDCQRRSLELSSRLARTRFGSRLSTTDQSSSVHGAVSEQGAPSPTAQLTEQQMQHTTQFISKMYKDFKQMTEHGLPPDKVLPLIITRLDRYCQANDTVVLLTASVEKGALRVKVRKPVKE